MRSGVYPTITVLTPNITFNYLISKSGRYEIFIYLYIECFMASGVFRFRICCHCFVTPITHSHHCRDLHHVLELQFVFNKTLISFYQCKLFANHVFLQLISCYTCTAIINFAHNRVINSAMQYNLQVFRLSYSTNHTISVVG